MFADARDGRRGGELTEKRQQIQSVQLADTVLLLPLVDELHPKVGNGLLGLCYDLRSLIRL